MQKITCTEGWCHSTILFRTKYRGYKLHFDFLQNYKATDLEESKTILIFLMSKNFDVDLL